VPKGSQSYVIDDLSGARPLTVGYLYRRPQRRPPGLGSFAGLDLLVCQCHFLHEPRANTGPTT